MQVRTLILQRIEITLHWSIVIRITGFAHALRDMNGFAKFNKCFGCKLRSMIAMQEQIPFYFRLRIQSFLQSSNSKITGNAAICNTGNHTSVVQIQDGAVVANFVICKKKIGEIRTPFLIDLVCSEILLAFIVKYLMRLPMLITRFLWAHNRSGPSSVFIYL